MSDVQKSIGSNLSKQPSKPAISKEIFMFYLSTSNLLTAIIRMFDEVHLTVEINKELLVDFDHVILVEPLSAVWTAPSVVFVLFVVENLL